MFTSGVEIASVYSREFRNARELSVQFGARAIDNVEDIDPEVCLNIVTIKDDAIISVIEKLPREIPIVHTSGAASIRVFEGFEKYGVLYPLQTFSKQRALDIAGIPFLIEGSTEEFETELMDFCQDNLSENVVKSDSTKRGKIHLAAVFACNFTTQLLNESDHLLQKDGLDLSLLHPLIRETLEKSLELGPEIAMTGPAKRGDVETMQKHMDRLEDEELRVLYKLLSERIKG